MCNDLAEATCKGAETQTQAVRDSKATHAAFHVMFFFTSVSRTILSSFNVPSSGNLPQVSDQVPGLLILCGSTCSKSPPRPKLHEPNLSLHKVDTWPKYGAGASAMCGALPSSQIGLLALGILN